jgi:hypothetical protein
MARRLCIREVSSSFQRIITILRSRQHQTHGVVDDPWCRMYILVRLSRSCHLLVDIPCFKLISSASTKPLPVLGPSKNPTIVYLPLLFGFLFFSLRKKQYIHHSDTSTCLEVVAGCHAVQNDGDDSWQMGELPMIRVSSKTLGQIHSLRLGHSGERRFTRHLSNAHNFCPCCLILWSASHLPEKPSIRW